MPSYVHNRPIVKARICFSEDRRHAPRHPRREFVSQRIGGTHRATRGENLFLRGSAARTAPPKARICFSEDRRHAPRHPRREFVSQRIGGTHRATPRREFVSQRIGGTHRATQGENLFLRGSAARTAPPRGPRSFEDYLSPAASEKLAD